MNWWNCANDLLNWKHQKWSASGQRRRYTRAKKNTGPCDLFAQAIALTDLSTGRLINVNDKFCELTKCFSIDGEASDILERGCNGFIQKPFTMKKLSGEIREILQKK